MPLSPPQRQRAEISLENCRGVFTSARDSEMRGATLAISTRFGVFSLMPAFGSAATGGARCSWCRRAFPGAP